MDVGDLAASTSMHYPTTGSVRTRPKCKFQAFRKHMALWSQRQHEMTSFEGHLHILILMLQF